MRRGQVAQEARRTAAEARQAGRDRRTDEQQLHKLINEGHGHCKEAQRLAGEVPEGEERSVVDDFIEGLTLIDDALKRKVSDEAQFCLACGASMPHREGEGRCELCLHHE